MRRILFVLAILFFSVANLQAQNISVVFKTDNAAGKNLYLLKYSDYITEMETVIFSAKIPLNGVVEHSFAAQSTEMYKLKINQAEETIYLQSNTSYSINISYPQTLSNINPFQNKQYLTLEITSSAKKDVNTMIAQFNETYDDFLLETLFHKSPKKILGEHRKFAAEYLEKIVGEDAFFKAYAEYSFGLTEVSLVDKIGKDFIDKYFTQKDVVYNSLEYFQLLKEVCKSTEYILKDSTSSNLRLKELTYLYFLMRDFYGDSEKEEVLRFIKAAVNKATYAETKQIGNNILKYLTRYRRGSNFPSINLESENGNEYSLSQGDKYSYLLFVNSDIEICADVVKELNSINFANFGIAPLLVAMDFAKTSIDATGFTLLKPKDVGVVLNELNIRSYPFAILLDKSGKIVRYDAPVTREKLEAFLKAF